MHKILDQMSQLITALREFELDIKKALKYSHGSIDYDNVVANCLSGRFDTYVLPNSVIICETVEKARETYYHVVVACGDLDEIKDAQRDLLVREAKLRKAGSLTLAGRLGWARALKDEGWSEPIILLRKVI